MVLNKSRVFRHYRRMHSVNLEHPSKAIAEDIIQTCYIAIHMEILLGRRLLDDNKIFRGIFSLLINTSSKFQ